MRREHHCGSGEAGEPAQDPRTGWPSSWTGVSLGAERTELGWRKPLYLPVFLRSRKHSRVASSSSPTRTPITMPEMVSMGGPCCFFLLKGEGKGEGCSPSPLWGNHRALQGEGLVGRRNRHPVSAACECCHHRVLRPPAAGGASLPVSHMELCICSNSTHSPTCTCPSSCSFSSSLVFPLTHHLFLPFLLCHHYGQS